MTDETFFERLRHDASQLQFTVDDVTVTRLTARVRARVGAQPTVTQLLAGWLRPLAAAVAAVTLAATLSLSWIDATPETGTTVDQIAANTTEISVDGMSFASE